MAESLAIKNGGGYTDAYNTTNIPLEIYGIK